MLGIYGRTAALSLTAAMLAGTGALLLPASPAFSPRALVAGLGAIPPRYLAWYQGAARTCPGLRWEVLAGIGTMESDNGRSRARGVHRGKNRKGVRGAIFAYNHAHWYVRDVLAIAARYTAAARALSLTACRSVRHHGHRGHHRHRLWRGRRGRGRAGGRRCGQVSPPR